MKRVAGFTLLEMVMVIVLLGVMAAVSAPLFSTTLMAYSENRNNIKSISDMRYAMERMAREIRPVRNTLSAYDFAPAITAASATSVSFTNTMGQVVTLAALPVVTPNRIEMTKGGVTQVLINNVSALTFNFFQQDGSTAAVSNAQVALVEIDLTLNSPSAGGPALTNRTRVALRSQP